MLMSQYRPLAGISRRHLAIFFFPQRINFLFQEKVSSERHKLQLEKNDPQEQCRWRTSHVRKNPQELIDRIDKYGH